MNTKVSTDVATTGISANLAALEEVLAEATQRIAEARQFMQRRDQNAAIGSILGLGESLVAAKHFYGATLTLHQLILR